LRSTRAELLESEPGALAAALEAALARARRGAAGLAPPPVVPLDALRERAAAREAGAALLRAGRVAALVVAGGQGTRLGHPGPKGSLPLGPVTERTLFGLQAQRLHGVARRFGAAPPWIVMTSEATDAATRTYFAAQDHFGLEVHFARQRSLPCVDLDGRPLWEAPGRPVRAPDGHGGMLAALADAGLLDALAARGIEALAYQQVDNPLARSAEPGLLGWLGRDGVEVATKVVRKRRPDERVGTVGVRDGRTEVVEYTELGPAEAEARGADGGLRLWAGAIGIHAFALGFLRRCAARGDALLPLHASAKPIPHLGPDGATVAPAHANGYKLERFVFDLLPEARAVALVEASREDEYAPVKNAQGSESPETARRALDACARRWLVEAGWTLPAEPCRIELDHSLIDSPEDAAGYPARDARAAGAAVRIGPGVPP
jgi:UDP-N-acetylglucosamine/UDP-N-acetylgalactosamine diphosphorylase